MAWVSWHQRRFAPAPGTKLIADSELSDGDSREFEFGEGKRPFSMLLIRYGDDVRGWVNACPHFQLPLNAAPNVFFNKAGTKLTCVHHYARFDPVTGDCLEGPCEGDALLPVPVENDGGCWVIGSVDAATNDDGRAAS